MHRSRAELLIAGLLVAASFAVFGPACRNGFVDLDDDDYVTENRHVQAGLTGAGIRWALTTTHAANWHPLTWSSLQLDRQLFGPEPWGFHLTNLLLHASNAVLLFLALGRMTGTLWRSACVAALFAVHPLHVESVAWVAERKDVLSTFFGMLALYAYARYVRYVEGPGRKWYALVVLAFALSLLAKPMLVTLPCLLLLLDYWPLGRLSPGVAYSPLVAPPHAPDAGTESAGRPSVRLVLREKLPLLLLAAGSCVVTWWAQQQGQGVRSLHDFPFSIRLENALAAYVAYLGKALWPVNLAVFYPHPGAALSVWQAAAAGVLLAAITLAVVKLAPRLPYLAVGWFWYLGTLVPVIGLVQVGYQAMADRYTYLPLTGLFISAVWGIADLAGRWAVPRIVVPVTVAVLALLMVRSWHQTTYWRDSWALWEHTLQATGPNAKAEYALGTLALKTGHLDEAIAHFGEALQLSPHFAQAHNNLGAALALHGQRDEAMRHYRMELDINPGNAEAHTNLGAELETRGQLPEATYHYAEAVRLNPEFALAQYRLGTALGKQGHLPEAIEHLAAALQLDPRSAAAHINLGMVFEMQGDTHRAIQHYTEAVHINPRSLAPYCNLARIWEEQGKWDDAVACAERARELAQAQGDAALAQELDARLRSYRQGRPFRQASPAPHP
jgi:tetratricopeptide (TPR) repeat protein